MKKWTGKGITKLREQLGLSVTEFAAALGVSVPSVYRWEAAGDVDIGAMRQVLEAFERALTIVKNDHAKIVALGLRVREGLYNLVLRGLN